MKQITAEIRDHYRFTVERLKKHRGRYFRSLAPAPHGYLVSVASVGVSILLKLAIEYALNISIHPFLLSSASIMFSAWYAGLGVGLAATLLSIVFDDMLFMSPRFTLVFNNWDHNIQSVIFFVEGAMISFLCDILRSSRIHAQIQTKRIHRHELELIASEKALKSLNRKKDEFINIASHELKTPLTSAMLLSQTLHHKTKTIPDASFASLSQKLVDQITRLNKLVMHLLDASRIQSGKLSLHIQTVRIDTVVEQSVEEFRATLPNRQISVGRFPKTYVDIDPERIQQVIENLLSNAAKYAPKETSIYVTMQRANDIIIINVKDFGPGIPDDQKENIFTRYVRLEYHQNTVSGMGLGLYIADTIVKNHGGKLWVDGKEGTGSTFSFSIPRSNGHR